MLDYVNAVTVERPLLLRIARRRIANSAWAEDAVSETVLAALEQPAACSGPNALRTWLVSILKHKLVDQIRRNTRELPLDDDDDDAPVYPSCAPQQADPQELLAHKQLVHRMAHCLDALPTHQGRAIVLRDWLGHETADVCQELGMNANTLYVTLHRARAALRTALLAHRQPGYAAAGAVGAP